MEINYVINIYTPYWGGKIAGNQHVFDKWIEIYQRVVWIFWKMNGEL